MGEETVVSTEDDDQEIDYGKWYVHTAETALAEANKLCPTDAEQTIWPHWSAGRPAKFRTMLMEPRFVLGDVTHQERFYYETLELEWSDMYLLSVLSEKYYFLPSSRSKSEWSGVYRIFSPNTDIDRCCGKDPTGTLYVGKAGAGGRNWSTLRTRILDIVTKRHHAMSGWSFDHLIRRKFPWNSLAVEWAYTGQTLFKGKPIPAAGMAESFLLRSYSDSFGELPPLNQKG
jgi:hypothetical protein